MRFDLRDRTDVEDLTTGCTFFGTGGGGDKKVGLDMLYPHVDTGKTIKIIDVADVNDNDWVACPYYSGTIAPPTAEVEASRTRFPWDSYEQELDIGLSIIEDYLDIKFQSVAPFELGGVNTPAPIDAATKHGIQCVDGDYAGRAVPEICQNTVCIEKFPMAPLALVDWYGNRTLVQDIVNYEMGERISKALSESAWGRVGNVGFPLQGAEFKKVIIPGTLSTSYNIGRLIRKSREDGDDPAERIVENHGGWVMFKGEVVEKKWENKAGYMWGETLVKGIGDVQGRKLRIWFKNENHITWLDDSPWVTSPDLIIVIEQHTGEPLTNTDINPGDNVSVIGMKAAHPMFRTAGGLAVLGPKHFGFDMTYRPIEDLV